MRECAAAADRQLSPQRERERVLDVASRVYCTGRVYVRASCRGLRNKFNVGPI